MFANPAGRRIRHHPRAQDDGHIRAPSGSDMFFDDVKTLYDLGSPESHAMRVEQTYRSIARVTVPCSIHSTTCHSPTPGHRPRYREAAGTRQDGKATTAKLECRSSILGKARI